MAMNEWKSIHCMLYKADTPRLRSTMQKIRFLISISAVTLKLIVKITSIFGSYRFLKIAWHDIFHFQTTFQRAGICIQWSSLQCRRFYRALANGFNRESAMFHVKGYYCYSPQSSSVIKWRLHRSDPNKLSPTQNTPALQATRDLAESKRKCSSSLQSNPEVNHRTHLKDSSVS